MEGTVQIGILLGLLALGYFAGSAAERKHFASLQEREAAYKELETTSLKRLPVNTLEVEEARLVTGNAVIAVDYFKVFAAGIRNLFGGRVSAYESLLDRARREATLRLKEEALGHGADAVINLRLETSSLGGQRQGKQNINSIEALAYGTAIRYRK